MCVCSLFYESIDLESMSVFLSSTVLTRRNALFVFLWLRG